MESQLSIPPRWLFWCAAATVGAAVPLLMLGAFVTTMGVGMADQRGLVNPVQAVQEFSAGAQSLGWKVEHSHRLAGWLVGVAGITLAIGAWLADPRWGGKALATLALVLIGLQGVLGIFRVSLNAWLGPELAWVHGSFAQLVFAVLVCTAVIYSHGWIRDAKAVTSARLRCGSLLCVGLVFSQLVLGGVIRHLHNLTMARLHLLNAFAVLAALLWLAKLVLDEQGSQRSAVRLLLVLLTAQILLGVESWFFWMQRYFDPTLSNHESMAILWVRSVHYFLGTLIFANIVVIALKAHRGLVVAAPAVPLQRTGGLA